MHAGQRGFTLIELLVAILIAGILMGIAVASYRDHTLRAARADAKAVLMESAAWLERFYTSNGRYDEDRGGTAVDLPFDQAPKSGAARYAISIADASITATDPGSPAFPASDEQVYTLKAVPQGASAGDDCGTLLLDSSGRMGVTGTGATVAECWQR